MVVAAQEKILIEENVEKIWQVSGGSVPVSTAGGILKLIFKSDGTVTGEFKIDSFENYGDVWRNDKITSTMKGIINGKIENRQIVGAWKKTYRDTGKDFNSMGEEGKLRLAFYEKNNRLMVINGNFECYQYADYLYCVCGKQYNNNFSENWYYYTGLSDVFKTTAKEKNVNPYLLAAYSAVECSMDEYQLVVYHDKTGKGIEIVIKGKRYNNVKVKNNTICAAVGLTSVQAHEHAEYNIEQLFDCKINIGITADEFALYNKKTIHDALQMVHSPNYKENIDEMKNYRIKGKTYWQVFVDCYNDLLDRDDAPVEYPYLRY